MDKQVGTLGETFAAVVAFKRFFPRVHPSVALEVGRGEKCLPAMPAPVWSLASVRPYMIGQMTSL